MTTHPRINPAVIDLVARVFNTHKKGLPEWMKNAREAYLRRNTPEEQRHVVINVQSNTHPEYMECIDFAGISGDDIENLYLEWAKPDAASYGLAGQEEGGQGNGGKAYLRQMFDKGYFVSIVEGKLSVVGFKDVKKYVLDFLPDTEHGKDTPGDSTVLRGIRNYASEWLRRYRLPPDGNITIVRGVSPKKPIDLERLIDLIQQFPQARQTIRACKVDFRVNAAMYSTLAVVEPALHPAFPSPIKIEIPSVLKMHGGKVHTARPPEFTDGYLELRVSAQPLQGQALATWNRVDFHGRGLTVIGWKPIDELTLTHPQYGRYLFGDCTVPLLVDPEDNYELQGRVRLNEGPLSDALYEFISAEANKILEPLANQLASKVAVKKRKNLENLNQRLSNWIETKLSVVRGLPESGEEIGTGKGGRKKRTPKEHEPAVRLSTHRELLHICRRVSYQVRAVAYDANQRPVPAGRTVWKSAHSAIASIQPESGLLEAKTVGMTTVTVRNEAGLSSAPMLVQVHDAQSINIRTPSPSRVGSNRRLPLSVVVKTIEGKTLKEPAVSWRSSDLSVVSIGQDGILVGGEVGDAEVVAFAGEVESETLEVIVEKGSAGKPKGGGHGRPRVLLSGQDACPFDRTPVLLAPTDPPVYQRPYKLDYDNNVFWINLQHPLAESLLQQGEESVQWRSYHFQRLVDVYTTLELRRKFKESEELDVDKVLDEIHVIASELYASAKDELYDLLFTEEVNLSTLEAQ